MWNSTSLMMMVADFSHAALRSLPCFNTSAPSIWCHGASHSHRDLCSLFFFVIIVVIIVHMYIYIYVYTVYIYIEYIYIYIYLDRYIHNV